MYVCLNLNQNRKRMYNCNVQTVTRGGAGQMTETELQSITRRFNYASGEHTGHRIHVRDTRRIEL